MAELGDDDVDVGGAGVHADDLLHRLPLRVRDRLELLVMAQQLPLQLKKNTFVSSKDQAKVSDLNSCYLQ